MNDSHNAKVRARALEILKVDPNRRCSCGGPESGTDHAPDCTWELAAEGAWLEAEQEAYEEGEAVLEARRVARNDHARRRGFPS